MKSSDKEEGIGLDKVEKRPGELEAIQCVVVNIIDPPP